MFTWGREVSLPLAVRTCVEWGRVHWARSLSLTLSLSLFICQMDAGIMPAFSCPKPCGRFQGRMCVGYNVS